MRSNKVFLGVLLLTDFTNVRSGPIIVSAVDEREQITIPRDSLDKMKTTLLCAALLVFCSPSFSDSYYKTRPEDTRALYLIPDKFPVHGDGVADDSDVLQNAINQVQEKHVQGILFVPSGRYRLSKTIYIWPGIRVIGYGPTRPVFVLRANLHDFLYGWPPRIAPLQRV